MNGNLKILVMGLGNILLSDDGVGVHVVNNLRESLQDRNDVSCVEGGTLGLSLLPEFDQKNGFIVVDAAELGAEPGTLAIFENEAMDQRLVGRKRSVHEVALSDLMDAALLTGSRPDRRALIAIQPETTEWGDQPTPRVAEAMEAAQQAALALIERWQP